METARNRTCYRAHPCGSIVVHVDVICQFALAVELHVSNELSETKSDVWQQKDLLPLLKIQYYQGQFITSRSVHHLQIHQTNEHQSHFVGLGVGSLTKWRPPTWANWEKKSSNQTPCNFSTFLGFFFLPFLNLSPGKTHRIHVWYIYLHLP